MLKKKLLPVLIEVTVIVSPSRVCCDVTVLFDRNKSVFEILLKEKHGHEKIR